MKYAIIICTLLLLGKAKATIEDTPQQDVINFIEGFLKGFIQDGETDLKEVLECIKEVIDSATYIKIWTDIKDAVQDLKNIDILHWDSIYKALQKLFVSVFDIYYIILPCIDSVKELQVIISLLGNLNPATLLLKVGKNILFHGGKLLSDLTDLYHQYQKGNWTAMGFDLADFIYNLLLKTELKDVSPGYLLIKGVLEGLAQDGANITDLLTCISDFSTIEDDWKEMITELDEIIHNMRLRDIFKIVHALKYVFNDLKSIFQQIENCGQAIGDIKNIINIFTHDDIGKLVEKFALNLIKHFGSIYEDIMSGISSYQSGDYESSGQSFGKALYEVFLG